MTASSRRVLIIEDESSQRLMYERALARMGFGAACADTPLHAKAELASSDFAVVLLDLNLAGESGMTLFEEIRDLYPHISVVIATGYGTLDAATQAIRMDAIDFLSKPISLDELENAMERAWSRHQLVQTPIADLVAPKSDEYDQASIDSLRRRRSLNIEDAERDLIIEALRRSNDNRKAAARMLGISERKLYYRLSQFLPRDNGSNRD
ncbi:MAG: response regulator [Phycisphaerales bacterium]|nr:response regulator [Phycisphaerales bacterium]MCB9837146.1 response regulator [Phycisphaera sp.]